MLRNREIRTYLLIMCTVGVTGTILANLLSFFAGPFVFIISFALISTSVFFTRWRYKEIEKLSGYLRKIAAGDYSLDVRDNEEGELSILKNEIYKVTIMLSEQGEQLKKDKIRLMDAISDISHQLKTPLTSMMVMADLLSNPQLTTDKRIEFTRNIEIQLERIEWLVSSLLKLSKIDAGTVQFKKETVNVRELVSNSVEPLLIPMDIKDQTLLIEGEDSTRFIGDFNWSREALLNILKNCVEHTQKGGTISIRFEENALFTEIIIADNGKGIGKEDLPYIFKRFYKGKNASDDSVGIGLAMAHSIVTSQMGDIDVKSEQNIGTEFRIKFYKQTI
ncbi:MAG TPA: HAMP domain-containing sensor histidine kinase [Bacillus sp. (in: firmicutes)]|uniref:sensor histidine kinase n=1 Tax=Bacillus litorisediminis TaxID=2922713 RepID=UPI001FACAE80|nr:HAMP domain-containing sensor histidine kinase [Bacillus litorisediminis]HWO74623.1 HAMP domain-containing sensor histidine kinase [Bacillus sp. (in: firmicutes)]